MYDKGQISEMITKDQKALERAVVAIYNLQTSSEQLSRETQEHNGVGFSGCDAGYLSYVAQYINDRKDEIGFGKILSGQYLTKTRNRMTKYAGQLTKIANKEL